EVRRVDLIDRRVPRPFQIGVVRGPFAVSCGRLARRLSRRLLAGGRRDQENDRAEDREPRPRARAVSWRHRSRPFLVPLKSETTYLGTWCPPSGGPNGRTWCRPLGGSYGRT